MSQNSTLLQKALDSLNPSQRAAATHIDGALLILAGAGSGKTKSITTRLAYLIDEVGIPPSSTLTLTFTNKAAEEMRERALSLLSISHQSPPLLSTFHKFGLLFLRFHIAELHRASNFIVLDSADRRQILKHIAKNLPIALIESYISQMKNSALSPSEALNRAKNAESKVLNAIYTEYQAYLLNKNLLDFDDLLYLTYSILHEHSDIAQNLSKRYQYIMVDEYQDTNELQSRILKYLCCTHSNLCVVGDDDQSIYGWRGADVQNILTFPQNFDDVKVIKLEENYRSSRQILQVANRLIAHNSQRLGKTLKSIRGDGEAVRLHESENESDEAMFLAKDIAKRLSSGIKPSDIAILFRLNALSRSIEEGFNRAKIPYRLIGAIRFYERAEIKDLLSYLRLTVNIDDDFSFLRIINRPRRGIGKITQSNLESLAAKKGLSCIATLMQYPKECIDTLGEKYKPLSELVSHIERWRSYEDLMEVIEDIQEHIIFTFNKADEVDREANIAEFYGKCRDFALQNPKSHIADFLNDLALSTPSDEVSGEGVQCMSVHTAKGLEFQCVYVIGLEDGLFPLECDEYEMQEERRLGYVAFTRARDTLTLCHSRSRLYRGRRERLKPSRFLRESGILKGQIDSMDFVDSTESHHINTQAISANNMSTETFAKGMQVRHKIFGIGVIESVRADSNVGSGIKGHGNGQCRLVINFAGLRREILSNFVQRI